MSISNFTEKDYQVSLKLIEALSNALKVKEALFSILSGEHLAHFVKLLQEQNITDSFNPTLEIPAFVDESANFLKRLNQQQFPIKHAKLKIKESLDILLTYAFKLYRITQIAEKHEQSLLRNNFLNLLCKLKLDYFTSTDQYQILRNIQIHFEIFPCLQCGCTESHACIHGCYWANADICSVCSSLLTQGKNDKFELKNQYENIQHQIEMRRFDVLYIRMIKAADQNRGVRLSSKELQMVISSGFEELFATYDI